MCTTSYTECFKHSANTDAYHRMTFELGFQFQKFKMEQIPDQEKNTKLYIWDFKRLKIFSIKERNDKFLWTLYLKVNFAVFYRCIKKRAEGEVCKYTSQDNSFQSELFRATRGSSLVPKVVPNVMNWQAVPNLFCFVAWHLVKMSVQFKKQSLLKTYLGVIQIGRTDIKGPLLHVWCEAP